VLFICAERRCKWLVCQRKISKLVCYNPLMKFFLRRLKSKVSKKSQEHYLLHKESARALIVSRVEYYATTYGFQYNRVAIKNTSTRWGSCSSLKNLNFNYKLALLDLELLDYVVVHELCHLRHMNHSKQYWQEVEQILPQYKNCIKQFKKISIKDLY